MTDSIKTTMSPMTRHDFRARRIFRYDPMARLFRLGRCVWQRGTVGDGQGYSVKLTLALHPRLWSYRREMTGFVLSVCGVRLHYQRSYGGINV